MTKYNKLVRDKILERLDKKGLKYKSHIATDEEYPRRLEEKLVEEVTEYIISKDPEELADILQVLYNIGKSRGIKFSEIELMRTQKYEKKGGFEKRIVLEEIEE